MSTFASVCWFKCWVTIPDAWPSSRATSWTNDVFPEPGSPRSRIGPSFWRRLAIASKFFNVVGALIRVEDPLAGPLTLGTIVLPQDTTNGVRGWRQGLEW